VKLDKEEHQSDTDTVPPQRKPVVIAFGLAGILVCIVLMINWLGPPHISVDAEILKRLIKGQQVDWGFVDTQGRLHIHLKRIQSIEDRKQTLRTDQLYVPSSDWNPYELEKWVASGSITLRQDQQDEGEGNPWPGILFIVIILGAGAYYLWRQAQWNLQYGSPRQQIDELSQELKDGKITQDEYQEKLDAITPHL